MRTLIGVVIVLVGLQLLLSSMNVANVPDLGDWWPLILIAIGVISWRSNPRMFVWPLILVGLGVIFQLQELDVVSGNAWNFIWPLVIILVGVQVLMGRQWKASAHQGTDSNAFVAFSGRDERVTGDFSHGQAQAYFGGVKYDLRDAKIGNDAVLEVFAAFGGIEILVPRNVQVRTKVTPIFGGSENKTQPDVGVSTILTVTGTAMFGGVEVKN